MIAAERRIRYECKPEDQKLQNQLVIDGGMSNL